MSGGSKVEVTKYGMSQHFGICTSVDAILAIIIKEKEAWTGRVTTQAAWIIDKPNLFGGPTKEGGAEGIVYFLPGKDTQILDDVLAVKLGRANGADCPGYRGIASIFFIGPKGTTWSSYYWNKSLNKNKGFYWSANVPYLPGVWITVRRAPVGLDPDLAMVARLGVDFFPYEQPVGALSSGTASAYYSPDHTKLVFASATGGYQVWDVATQTMISSGSQDSSAVAVMSDGSFYGIGGDTPGLWYVSASGGISVVVEAAEFGAYPGSLPGAGVYSAGGVIWLEAAITDENAWAVAGPLLSPIFIGFRARSYIEDASNDVWCFGSLPSGSGDGFGMARLSSGLAVYIIDDGVSSDDAWGMDNGAGQMFVWHGDYIMLINKETGDIEAGPTAAPSVSGTNESFIFRGVSPGDQSIWIGFTEVSTRDLSTLRTLDPNDWVGGAVNSPIYDPINHAIWNGALTIRFLDRGEFDANPAHIIYECLTNTDWGMGSASSAIDLTSFGEAAVTLASESLGLSLIWTRQATIEKFINEILQHIQAVLFVDPGTGLLTLKLVRGDYDIETLPDINPSNARLSNFSRKAWGDIANEISVTWTNPENEQEETVTVQDLGSIATQGAVITDSRNYYGVRTAELAQRLGLRDMRSAGAPLAGCDALVDRSLYLARPASVYTLTWPEHGLSGVVMRVIDVDYGKPGDMRIALTLLEDVYGLDIGEYTVPPGTIWEDPSSAPAAITNAKVITLPAYMAQNSTTDVSGAVYPEVMAGVLAVSEDEDTQLYELWGQTTTSAGDTEWQLITENNLVGYGALSAALDAEAESTGVGFDGLIGDVIPDVGVFVFIGDGDEDAVEIAFITASGSSFTLSRGVLDTVPRAWPAGTEVRLVDDETLFEDPTSRAAGEEVDYRLLSRTSLGLLDLSSAPVLSGTLIERPWLPNRPANVTIDGVQFNTAGTPVDMTGEIVVPVTWSNRNRLLEDTEVLAWTDGDIAPETGQTTTITVLDEDGVTVLDTITGLTGTSYDVPFASFGLADIAIVRVSSSRTDADGTFESLQAHDIYVQVSAARLTEDSIARVTEGGIRRGLEG